MNSENQYQYNIFARELVATLQKRNKSLWSLVSLIGVHPNKVQRLVKSLTICMFPTLNGEEMQRLYATLDCIPQERRHLRAAILTAAVQAIISDRFNPQVAIHAAEKILPVFEALLAVDEQEEQIFVGLEAGERMTEENTIEQVLETILPIMDMAALSLHLSVSAHSLRIRQNNAQQAQTEYSKALVLLDAIPEQLKQTEGWQNWHAEAQTELTRATELIQQLSSFFF